SSVCVPIQRHLPFTSGVIFAGTPFAIESACDVTAIIGCENVIDRFGAISTSPCGEKRVTSSVFGGSTAGGFTSSGGGKEVCTVAPVRGAGSERSRNAKLFVSELSASIG